MKKKEIKLTKEDIHDILAKIDEFSREGMESNRIYNTISQYITLKAKSNCNEKGNQ